MISEQEDYIVVKAKKIDNVHIYYECPFCWTIRNGKIKDSNFNRKTKKLYMSAKPTIHRHGSGGDKHNRYETRVSHCSVNNNKEIKIIIDEETIRC